MADYNSSKSSSSGYSCDVSSESDLYHRSESDTQGTGNSEQTENERLRYKVKSLRAELHQTMDSLEQAQHNAARQKRLTELKVSIVVSGLGDGRYAGYENGRVIYSWERKQREYVENAARFETERRRLETMSQAAQQRSEARLRAAGLDAWIQAPHAGNPSARRRLI
jgi:hypothetical protein